MDAGAMGLVKGLPFWIGLSAVAITIVALVFRSKKGKPLTLDGNKIPLKLVEKIIISHDTRLFRFALPSPKHVLGLPTGNHVHLSATVDGKMVVRPYTPVSSDDDLGVMDLVVKVYFKNVHPKFPDGGKLSQYLNELALGETIDVRGPSGNLTYKGNGNFAIRPDKKTPASIIQVKHVNMVAGGSGITPMLQIVKAIIKEKNPALKMSLIFANQTEEDILCRSDLETIVQQNPDQFKLWYTLDRPPTEWKYSTGFISDTMVKEHFYPPAQDTLVLMCGPPPMINFACNPALEKLNYDTKLCFAY